MFNSEMSDDNKDEKNYCCTSAASQAMLLQMQLLCVDVLVILLLEVYNNWVCQIEIHLAFARDNN
jgi:hypothetical protein